MKKTIITVLAVAAIAATAANATTSTNVVKNADGSKTTTTTTVTTTTAKPVQKAVVHHHHRIHHTAPVASNVSPANPAYREIHVGDPTVVYHGIGTGGAQRDNTIVPMWHEPIQSVKPYEIRYDYSI